MAPSLLLDISDIDLDQVQYDKAAIQMVLPHRGHMQQLDRIVRINADNTEAVAIRDVRPDEFWVEGHIPGRPLLPGVLMIEASAQLASFVTIKRLKLDQFLGFIGADDVKFRGQVVPGDRLILLSKELSRSRRRFVCAAQAVRDGAIVFEGTLTGMVI